MCQKQPGRRCLAYSASRYKDLQESIRHTSELIQSESGEGNHEEVKRLLKKKDLLSKKASAIRNDLMETDSGLESLRAQNSPAYPVAFTRSSARKIANRVNNKVKDSNAVIGSSTKSNVCEHAGSTFVKTEGSKNVSFCCVRDVNGSTLKTVAVFDKENGGSGKNMPVVSMMVSLDDGKDRSEYSFSPESGNVVKMLKNSEKTTIAPSGVGDKTPSYEGVPTIVLNEMSRSR